MPIIGVSMNIHASINSAPIKKYMSVFTSQFMELSTVVVIMDMHMGSSIKENRVITSPLNTLPNSITPMSPPKVYSRGMSTAAISTAAFIVFSMSFFSLSWRSA